MVSKDMHTHYRIHKKEDKTKMNYLLGEVTPQARTAKAQSSKTKQLCTQSNEINSERKKK